MKKFLTLGVLLAALFVAPVHAKPVHAAASISLVEPLPVHLGQTIHFNYTNPDGLKSTPCQQGVYNCSWLQVACYQGPTRVYYASKAGADTFTQFTLGVPGSSDSTWLQVGGPADCQADLLEIVKPQHQWEEPQRIIYASTFFHAEG